MSLSYDVSFSKLDRFFLVTTQFFNHLRQRLSDSIAQHAICKYAARNAIDREDLHSEFLHAPLMPTIIQKAPYVGNVCEAHMLLEVVRLEQSNALFKDALGEILARIDQVSLE